MSDLVKLIEIHFTVRWSLPLKHANPCPIFENIFFACFSTIFLNWILLWVIQRIFMFVIRQKGEFQNRGNKKNKANFPKNKHFLSLYTHSYVCVSGGKEFLFFGQFDVLFFLVTSVFRFAILHCYRRYTQLPINILYRNEFYSFWHPA